MSLALVIKFQYHAWNRREKDLITLDEHQKLLDKNGKCWWGRVTTISQDKLERVKDQLTNKEPSWLFLYCIAVPKNIHDDGILWYRAKLEDLTVGSPTDKNLIPDYYRTLDLGVSFLISSIEPILYASGNTPKVPAQASIRYASLNGSPIPESLNSWPDGGTKLCRFSLGSTTETKNSHHVSLKEPEIEPMSDENLPTVTELLAEIRELNIENKNLRSYMDFFKRFDEDFLFSSEKLLESWLESSIHRIFPELEIIERQPHASWPDGKFGKLDLLSFNKETKAFAIIEVKTRKRRIASGYDQFMRYTTWAKRNINSLIKKYNLQTADKDAKVEFYIISDVVNDEMKAICEEYDIRLVRIMGGIGFEVLS